MKTRLTSFIIGLLGLCFSIYGWALGEAHLTFHMGFGANGQFVVGGTIENQGNDPVERGYIMILPVNDHCKPLDFLWQGFGPIPPNGKIEFKIPVTDPKFNRYRLAGFAAFDEMGFVLPTKDDTAEIIQARQPAERETCQISQQEDEAKTH